MARRIPPSASTARLTLRTTTPSDLPTLVLHRRRMWEEIGRRTRAELDRADPAYRRWVVRETRARRFIGFLVEDPQGRVAGSGAVWLQPAQPRPGRLSRLQMPYIMSMYTEPAFRRRGVASRIVRAMVRWATLHGYRRIFLHASPAGRPVYQRLGFASGSEMRLELPRRRTAR